MPNFNFLIILKVVGWMRCFVCTCFFFFFFTQRNNFIFDLPPKTIFPLPLVTQLITNLDREGVCCLSSSRFSCKFGAVFGVCEAGASYAIVRSKNWNLFLVKFFIWQIRSDQRKPHLINHSICVFCRIKYLLSPLKHLI